MMFWNKIIDSLTDWSTQNASGHWNDEWRKATRCSDYSSCIAEGWLLPLPYRNSGYTKWFSTMCRLPQLVHKVTIIDSIFHSYCFSFWSAHKSNYSIFSALSIQYSFANVISFSLMALIAVVRNVYNYSWVYVLHFFDLATTLLKQYRIQIPAVKNTPCINE